MTVGWRGAADGLLPARQVVAVEGHWPARLQGTLFCNGPGLFERSGVVKAYLLDGDGLIQAWRFAAGRIRYQAAFVQTSKFLQEQKEARFLYPGLASVPPDPRPVFRPDDINTANTSLIVHGGALLALWEAGSAHVLDPETLQTRGLRIWSPESEGAPFGAHPKRDSCGNLWAIGVAPGHLLIYQIAPDGSLRQVKSLRMQTSALVHDFALTENHLLVWMAPLELRLDDLQRAVPLLQSMSWNREAPGQLVIIERSHLEVVRVLEVAPQLQTHVANAWEDAEGIHWQHVCHSFESLVHGLTAIEPAAAASAGLQAQASLCHLQLSSGTLTVASLPGLVEFPQIDPRWAGRRHRITFHLEIQPRPSAAQGGFNGLQRLDLATGLRRGWLAPEGVSLQEHVFLPRSKAADEGCGWLLGTGFDAGREASFCSLFDAEHLEDGPLAMAYLDGPVPACLHGQFVAS